MQSSDWTTENPTSYQQASQKIQQALALLREARAELQPWAPPADVNDLQAAEDVLSGFAARAGAR